MMFQLEMWAMMSALLAGAWLVAPGATDHFVLTFSKSNHDGSHPLCRNLKIAIFSLAIL